MEITNEEHLPTDILKNFNKIKMILEKNLNNLNSLLSNNAVKTLQYNNNADCHIDYIDKKLKNKIEALQQIDGHKSTITSETNDVILHFDNDMTQDFLNIKTLLNDINLIIDDLQSKIYQIESQLDCFTKLKTNHSIEQESWENVHQEEEFNIIKHVFKSTKDDLANIIEQLFPDQEFSEIFGVLTNKFNKGGDDVYMDVTDIDEKSLYFLIINNLAVYHPNDETKIKLSIE